MKGMNFRHHNKTRLMQSSPLALIINLSNDPLPPHGVLKLSGFKFHTMMDNGAIDCIKLPTCRFNPKSTTYKSKLN